MAAKVKTMLWGVATIVVGLAMYDLYKRYMAKKSSSNTMAAEEVIIEDAAM